MHALLGAMLTVHVTVMQIVNMVAVQHRFVSTPGTVGVTVVLSLGVLHRGHRASLSGEPSHAYIRSYEWQDPGWVVMRPQPSIVGSADSARLIGLPTTPVLNRSDCRGGVLPCRTG